MLTLVTCPLRRVLKWVRMACCAALCVHVGVAVCAEPSTQSLPVHGTVTAEIANIRAGNSLQHEVLCQVSAGQDLTIREQRFEWYRIALPDTAVCYIHANFVGSLRENNTLGTVTADRVNLRAGTSLDSTILGQVNHGQELFLKSREGDWYRVVPPKQASGWIHSQLVRVDSDTRPIQDVEPTGVGQSAASSDQTIPENKDAARAPAISPEDPPKPSTSDDLPAVAEPPVTEPAIRPEDAVIIPPAPPAPTAPSAESDEPAPTPAALDSGPAQWVGTIKEVPPRLFRIRRARFQLIDRKRPVAYLTSDEYTLETFLHRSVVLHGDVIGQESDGLPLLRIDELTPATRQ